MSAGTDDASTANSNSGDEHAPRGLTPAAQRALAEAEERRARQRSEQADPAPEVGGRAGPDPARYGDWENKGIASDF